MQDISFTGSALPVLLFHGLRGHPLELHLVAQRLAAAGHAVRLPYLTGYGQHPGDCGPVPPHEAWEEMALAHLAAAVAASQGAVVVGGLGAGAGLALRLARRAPEQVAGLVLMSANFYHDGWGLPWYHRLLPLVGWLPFGQRCRWRESYPFGVKNHRVREWISRQMERTGHSVAGPRELSLAALGEARRMMARVRRDLPEIAAPALILHAAEDELSSLRSPSLLAGRLGSSRIEKQVFADSYHRLTLDNDRYAVAQACVDFVGRLEPASGGSLSLAA